MIQAVFRPAAAADIEDAYDWYESQRAGLGDEFMAVLNTAVESISENPFAYPVIHRQTRRLLLRRFPYGLYFRLLDNHPIIIACMHGSRDPIQWQSRG